jgi:hypothetical protein
MSQPAKVFDATFEDGSGQNYSNRIDQDVCRAGLSLEPLNTVKHRVSVSGVSNTSDEVAL